METKGLPLEIILMSLNKEKYVIDWIDFLKTSIEHNWKIRGTLIKIESALIDVYGKNEYTETIIKNLSLFKKEK